MKRSSGARLCSMAAVGALSLALVTGCSSDSGEGSKKKDATDSKGSASAPASDAKALTSAELEKLLLAKGDVKGYRFDSGVDTLPTSKSAVKTDKAACDPLAWATAGLAPGDTGANASNSVTEDKTSAATASPDEADIEDAFDVNLTFVGLSSYDGDGAVKAVKAVSDGVAACASGYGLKADGEDSKVTKVVSEKGTGGGDEAVAFAEDVDMDGEGTATFHTEVIRKGNTVATFYTVNFAAFGSGGDMDPVPAAVVTAQLGKLG
ncbi:hypothetical protein [Streptomyces sp. NPDC002588]|uniref:hypothetical protein n=1 Tax=Streptomyces sp. NPDC002588 TaxID=3154419 RepID=UPI0033286521